MFNVKQKKTIKTSMKRKLKRPRSLDESEHYHNRDDADADVASKFDDHHSSSSSPMVHNNKTINNKTPKNNVGDQVAVTAVTTIP